MELYSAASVGVGPLGVFVGAGKFVGAAGSVGAPPGSGVAPPDPPVGVFDRIGVVVEASAAQRKP